jgi:hypothetical protein
MGVVVTYLAYLVISIALTVFVGSALSRSGRVFLRGAFGDQAGPAEAASRLLVVGFYLLNLGFVTLTMRMSGEVASARAAIQVLSVKIGEVLLVLGALYLLNIGFLARLRNRMQAQPASIRPAGDRPDPDAADRPPETTTPPPDSATPPPGWAAKGQPGLADPARSAAPGRWPPRPRQALH